MKKQFKEPYQNLEEAVITLQEKAKKGDVPLKTFMEVLGGRGRVLLLILVSLGFGQIPGAILVFGPLIIYLGLRIAIGRSFNWSPRWLEKKKIPSFFMKKNAKQTLSFLKFLKRWTYPRYVWATHGTAIRITNGLMIALIGLALSISPPVPFASWVGFLGTFLIGIGLLNSDGLYILAGHFSAISYFILVCFLCKYCSLSQMIDWVIALNPF